MSYFKLPNAPATSDAFVDKLSILLPSSHRFADLATKLLTYQGLDILPLTQGDNDLLKADVKAKAYALHEQLLHRSPMPDACVLVLLTDESSPKLLLTKRASNLSSHAGEMALVGGKRDDTDRSSWGVALREAYEEVGLCADDASLVGYLPMQMSKNGLLVRPVVATVSADVKEKLTPSEDEIAKIFWVDWQYLQNSPPIDWVFYRTDVGKVPMNLHTPAWLIDTKPCLEPWHLDMTNRPSDPDVLWGLTGRILANLLQIGYGIDYPWYYRLSPYGV